MPCVLQNVPAWGPNMPALPGAPRSTCLLPAAPASSPQHLAPARLPNQPPMPVPPSPIPRSYTNIVGLQGGVNGFLRVFDARLNPKGAHMWGV